MERGKTPTTPTISSIIAGVQCQEAVKLLHGMPTIAGKGWVFNGLATEAYTVEYQRKEDCYSHETLEQIIELPVGASTITVGDMLKEVRRALGPTAELELPRDVLEKLTCPKCGREETFYCSLGKVKADKAPCPHCADVRRDVVTFYKIRGTEAMLDRTLEQIGVPAYDILIGRTRDRAVGFELSGDASKVLGPLCEPTSQSAEAGLEWE
jgi:adenylyltransferase/sulfurtransferase